jgi:hypothetical protein
MKEKTIMGTATLLAIGCAGAVMFYIAGCTCECEMQCDDGNGTYTVKTVEMKRSECRELNDEYKQQQKDSIQDPDVTCSYRCAD